MSKPARAMDERLVLPLPPSDNEMWKKWRNRIVLSPEARRYKQSVKLRALTQGFRDVLEGDVVFSMVVYRKDRRRDLANFEGVLEDALEGVLYVNDRQIAEKHTRRTEDPANPRVEVWVEAVKT